MLALTERRSSSSTGILTDHADFAIRGTGKYLNPSIYLDPQRTSIKGLIFLLDGIWGVFEGSWGCW